MNTIALLQYHTTLKDIYTWVQPTGVHVCVCICACVCIHLQGLSPSWPWGMAETILCLSCLYRRANVVKYIEYYIRSIAANDPDAYATAKIPHTDANIDVLRNFRFDREVRIRWHRQ